MFVIKGTWLHPNDSQLILYIVSSLYVLYLVTICLDTTPSYYLNIDICIGLY